MCLKTKIEKRIDLSLIDHIHFMLNGDILTSCREQAKCCSLKVNLTKLDLLLKFSERGPDPLKAYCLLL